MHFKCTSLNFEYDANKLNKKEVIYLRNKLKASISL